MATNEYKGRLTYIDGDGNQNVLYPMTSKDAVDGLDEELSAKQNALPTGTDGQILVYDNNGSLVASDNEALTTATGAATDAATALQRATLAMSEGSEAKSLATDAGSAASQAQDTADLAYETAVQAEKAANDALEAIEENAITVDSALSDSSTNPVQNKVIKAALDEKATTANVEQLWTIAQAGREEAAIAQGRADEAYNLAYDHEHSASDITKGTLPPERGGTGNTSVDTAPTSGSTKMVTSGGVYTALSGKADASHGNHVPATETADNAKFLRNDNTWQKVTPANIDAAPTNHASTGTGYGIGTGSNYGHVKLSDATNSSSAASAGIAASPKAVKAAYDLANTANSAAATAQTTANNAATAAANAQTTANGKASTATYMVSIDTSWTANSAGGYYKTVTVSGILASDNPIADVVLGSDVDANALYLEAWACVTRITTAANSITLYANGDAPTTAFTCQLKAVR